MNSTVLSWFLNSR